MKKIFITLILFNITFNLFSQIEYIRELQMDNSIIDITNHSYKFFVCCSDNSIYLWNRKIANNKKFLSIACNKTGGYLAASSDNQINIWELGYGEVKKTSKINYHEAKINFLIFSNLGILASSDENNIINLIDIKNNTLKSSLIGHTKKINSLAFNSTGLQLASCSNDSSIIIWNLKSYNQSSLFKNNSAINSISYSPDNKNIAFGTSDCKVKILDIKQNIVINEFTGHNNKVNSVAYNHNGFYLASCSDDNSIIIWSLEDEKKYKTLYDHTASVKKILFFYDAEKDKEFLISISEDKTLKIWDVTSLPLPYHFLIKQDIDKKIVTWEQKKQEESIKQFQKRVSRQNRIKYIQELENFFLNKYAKEKYSFNNPNISEYNAENETFQISYDNIINIEINIPKSKKEIFQNSFYNLQITNFQFELENNDFKLVYLELSDTKLDKKYYYDKTGDNEIYNIDEEFVPPPEVLVEVATVQDTLENKLNNYIKQKKEENIISDNINTEVKTKVIVGEDVEGKPELNYHIEYSYEVIKTTIEGKTDDFPPGKYKLTSSNAARTTCQLIKETFENELYKYIKSGMPITIKITGSTDGTPIRNVIPYGGEYGEFKDEPYFLNNNLTSMFLNKKNGITKNEQLAFLRTYGVREFMTTYIDVLKKANVSFQHYAVVAKEKGSQYRRISVEIILHGAFDNFKKENTTEISNVDNQPPEIFITSPNVRGFKLISEKKEVIITGVVTDKSGVYEVIINDEEVNMESNGIFSHTVLLAVGDNLITVTATDTKRNTIKQEFTIERKSNQQVAVVNNQTDNSQNLQTGKYYALIIGNNDYQDPAINSLDGPINDATKLYNVLTTDYTFEPQNVTFLKNTTYVQMIEAFDYLSNTITENDNLLIFYAGHGWWDETKKLGYWLPSDAQKNSTAFWIANSRISDYMSSIKSKHTLLIADACFSGSIFKTRIPFKDANPAINKLYALPSRTAMTSGNLKEVPDKSVFLKYLVERLDENKNKYLSADQLFTSFRIAVMDNSDTEPQFGTIQNSGSEGGEFIFIRKE